MKLIKWCLIALGSLLGLAVLALAFIYVSIGSRLGAVHDVPSAALAIPTDEDSVREGERLARIKGCNGGCHGGATEGGIFLEMPDGSRVVAPDLGRIATEYSAVDLARVIRHGVRPDGTSVLGIMPSSMLYWLSDRDVSAIIAYLQTQPQGNEVLPKTRLGPVMRAMLWYYSGKFDWNILPAEEIDHDAVRPEPDSGDALTRGRYQALTTCTECHGDDLRGVASENIPSLAIVAAYSLEDFETLLRTGVPIGGRELDLMARVSRSRFVHFTDGEVADLHIYLRSLAVEN